MVKKMTYAGSGVRYDVLDAFKRAAQSAARETVLTIEKQGYRDVSEGRGESAHLMETLTEYVAHTPEALGTKNLVADAMYKLTGTSYYGNIGHDAVAAIVNDIAAVGAQPLSASMFLAAGHSRWFQDARRWQDIIFGWKEGCMRASCAWGGGETQVVSGIVALSAFLIGGSAVGIVRPKERRIDASSILKGDCIVFFESWGLHTNGYTLARKIAKRLPQGYLSRLSDGRTYGEALLDPSVIYVPVVQDCLDAGIDVHYAVPITGHGWRKLMRPNMPFVYVIERLPDPQPIFTFLQERGPVDDREAYATFNMGAGFALIVPESDAERTVALASRRWCVAWRAGYVDASGRDRKVVIAPKNLEYDHQALEIR